MAVKLSEIEPIHVTIEGLEILPATTARDILAFGEIMLALFGDTDEGRAVFTYYQNLSTYPRNTFPDMHLYLGKLHDTVVATGMVFIGSQTAGIYDLATLPAYRKRGIGSAIFQHLLEDALASHHHTCVLQASQAGLGIYLQAGFKPVGNVHVFENRGLL